MKRRSLLSIAVLAVCLGLTGFSAAQSGRPIDAVLRFQGDLDYTIGEEAVLFLQLETETGAPIGYQEIEILLDGAPAGTVETDPLGGAVFRLEGDLAPGSYAVSALYRGFQYYRAASVTAALNVEPAEIVVQTVPVIAGLAFSLDGQVRSTGPDGLARFSLSAAGAYELELLPDQEVLSAGGAVFDRWWPGGLDPVVSVTIPGETWLQAGFELGFPADFSFVDLHGQPVDGARIQSALLRGSDGSVHRLRAGETLWLRSNRILSRLDGLDSMAVVHSVQSVIVDGVEVVNRGQQRFIFAPERSIEIEVLFYDVRFLGHDLLAGLPIGSGVELVYPDGERIFHPFDSAGELALTGLARGDYEARLVTRAGLAPAFPIVLSRDQEIRLPVVSFLDLAAACGTGLLILVGLPIFGRRRLIADRFRRGFRFRARGGGP